MSDKLVVPYNFIPRWYQLKIFQVLDGIKGDPKTKIRRVFMRWHRRAGKDKACFAYMAKEMIATRGIYYYFFPNYQQGRKALWEEADMMQHLPESLIAKRNNNEMLLTTTNGSIFRVIGTDNIDTIVGTNPIGCVFSEYALQDPNVWKYISPILAQNKGWAIFNSTPRGRNHMFKLENLVKSRDNWHVSELQSLWPDRPNYSGTVEKEAMEEEMALHGLDHIEQEYGVSYSAGVKGAYYAQQVIAARKEGRIGSFVYDSSLCVDTFWDLGRNDSTVVWFGQTIGNKIIFIDYLEDNGKTIPDYADMLIEKGYRYRTHYLPHDGNRKVVESRLQSDQMLKVIFRDAGISDDVVVVKRPRIKQDAINAVRNRFSCYFFNTDCPEMEEAISNLELYHKKWNPRTEVFMDEPAKDGPDHCADALSTEAIAYDEYSSYGAMLVGKPEVVDEYDPRT